MAGNRLLPRPSSPRNLVGRRPRALPRANPPASSSERGDVERDQGQPRLAGPYPRASEGPGQVIRDPWLVARAVDGSKPIDPPGIPTPGGAGAPSECSRSVRTIRYLSGRNRAIVAACRATWPPHVAGVAPGT